MFGGVSVSSSLLTDRPEMKTVLERGCLIVPMVLAASEASFRMALAIDK